MSTITKDSKITSFGVGSASGEAIYVAIDVAKYFHKAIIFDMNKTILEQPFGFDLSRGGFNQLVSKIEAHTKKQNIKKIVVGLEATGHYHETLVDHLRSNGYQVFLFNPYSTFKTRSLRLDYVKTDEIDVKAIGDAMILNKGREITDQPEIYRQLKLLTRFRRAKVRARQILTNQMLRDLDRLWPGMLKDAKDNKSGLFTNIWKSKIGRKVMELNSLPQDIALARPQEFVRGCKDQGIEGIGISWAKKIIKHASQVLPCPREEAVVHRKIMEANLKLLKELDDLIDDLGSKIAVFFQNTPCSNLLSIKGLSIITAAEFIAEVGNPDKYSDPGQWIKLAGLNASRYQTGTTDRKNNPITKVGNKNLRYMVFMIARNISIWEPFFTLYRNKFLAKGKHIRKAHGAVANKFLRVAFYMLKKQENFDPDYEKKKEKKCLTQS